MAFKSLEDVYANQCAGKPVVPLQRHVLNEQYYVTLTDNKTAVVKNQQISPDLYAKFRREVSRTSNVQIGSQSYTVNEIIDMGQIADIGRRIHIHPKFSELSEPLCRNQS